MYLEYEKYLELGGTLEICAFKAAEREARYLLNSQAGGQTGERISKLKTLPEGVEDCIFELISFSVSNPAGQRIASESQSQGGKSESVSYVAKTEEDINNEKIDIIYKCMYGSGLGELLYRGGII